VVELSTALGLLRRRLLPLLLCVLTGIASAALVVRGTPATYLSTSSLIITLPRATGVGEALQGVQLSTQLLQSYAALATSRSAAEAIKTRLNLPDSVDAIRGKVSAAPRAETLLVTISAVDTDALRSQRIADAGSLVLISDIAALEGGKQDKVQASVVDRAQPGSQVGPRTTLVLTIGLLLGLIAGLALSLLLEALDRTVKTAAQISDLFHAPLLSAVPRLKPTAVHPGASVDQPLSIAGEAYRALRTAVFFTDLDTPLRTILVTSPSSAEGKTTISSNLAVALAQSGQTVVLVDADLRRGRVLDLLGLPTGAGVTSVVSRQASLDDCLQEWRGLLTVLGAGPIPPNPSEILGSQVMHALLDDLRSRADVVIIDGAPVLPVTDSVVLSTQVDGVILVARSGQTQRSAAAETRRRLEAVGANVIGCVLNAATNSATQGYYADYSASRTDDVAATGLARFGLRLGDNRAQQ
jgi:succinoglycan biosynthesis transport protein ExoP